MIVLNVMNTIWHKLPVSNWLSPTVDQWIAEPLFGWWSFLAVTNRPMSPAVDEALVGVIQAAHGWPSLPVTAMAKPIHTLRPTYEMPKRLTASCRSWNKKTAGIFLRSFMPAIDFERHEVLVVDNGSRDGTDEMVASEFPQVRYFPLDKNIGVGPARNRGISLATGEMIMILDNDTEVLDMDFPEVIERAFAEDPKLGLLGFRLENPTARRSRARGAFPRSFIRSLLASRYCRRFRS